MPLYEYECSACHKRTEKIQKFSDPELTVCPFCGGPLARTITAPAVSFKGGGWYADLYSSSKPKASGEASSDSGKSDNGSKPDSGSSTESKPAAAPASTPAPAPAAAATSSDKK
jgi:putative FmdB family regulatory protein